jgi:hypothetical protein
MKYKNVTKAIGSVVAVVVLVLQSPQVQGVIGPFLGAHANTAAIVAGVAAIAALFHTPTQAA